MSRSRRDGVRRYDMGSHFSVVRRPAPGLRSVRVEDGARIRGGARPVGAPLLDAVLASAEAADEELLSPHCLSGLGGPLKKFRGPCHVRDRCLVLPSTPPRAAD